MLDVSYGMLYTFVSCILQYSFLCIFLRKKYHKKTIVCIGVWILISLVCSKIFKDYFILKIMITIIYGTIITLVCFSDRIIKKISLYLMAGGLNFLCDIIVSVFAMVAINSINLKNSVEDGSAVFLGSISLFLYSIIIIVLHRYFGDKINESLTHKFYGILIVLATISFVIEVVIVISYDPSFPEKIRYIFLFMSLIIVLINIVIFLLLKDVYFNEIQSRENRIGIEKENNYRLMYNDIVEKYGSNKKHEHDVKNHLEIIKILAKKSDNEKLINYISDYEDTFDNDVFMTDNVVIDAIINNKYKCIREKDIAFIVNIDYLDNYNISDVDLVTILSNLIDNAIEACSYCKNNKYIKLMIEQENKNLYIFVFNSYDGFIHANNNLLITRKKDLDKHGIGLLNVKEIVEKYEGFFDVEYNENEFGVKLRV